MRAEFEVHLSLPVEAESIQDAVEEFKADVASGVKYVYGVDWGAGRVIYDEENGEVTEDYTQVTYGKVRGAAEYAYAIAQEVNLDTHDGSWTDYENEQIKMIEEHLRSLFGLA